MPAWWSKKSGKNKQTQHQEQEDEEEPRGALIFNLMRSPINIGSSRKKGKEKHKSFDELFVSRNSPSPRKSKEFSNAVDGDRNNSRGVPLPRPSVSSNHSFGNEQGLGFGSASVSGSSVSSSTSYDDHPISPQFVANRFFLFDLFYYYFDFSHSSL